MEPARVAAVVARGGAGGLERDGRRVASSARRGTAGRSLDQPVWQRCARWTASEAAAVAEVAHRLPIDHLVEHGGNRYAVTVRPIHADGVRTVVCP